MSIVVAIDGPAGSGKSSVSKAVASARNFRYLDTGAAYRAVAWFALEQSAIPLDDEKAAELLDVCGLEISTDPQSFRVTVNETNVTDAIRESRVTEVVSAVSAVPLVRQFLNDRFRHEVARAEADQVPGIVVEGRDITSVVLPDADLRILLTADANVRAARRAGEVASAEDHSADKHVHDRDAADAKVSDFMTAAPGVRTVDSTHLDLDQTVVAVGDLIETVAD